MVTVAILANETQSAISKEKVLLRVYEELCLNKQSRQDKQRNSGKMSAIFSDIVDEYITEYNMKLFGTSTPSMS